MMNPALSLLPQYLSPVGGASVGLNSLPEAGRRPACRNPAARPARLAGRAFPVSDGVEDHAPHTHLAIRKLEAQLVPLRMLVAVEAMTAAQAVHLRGTCRRATRVLLDAIRSVVPPLAAGPGDRAPTWTRLLDIMGRALGMRNCKKAAPLVHASAAYCVPNPRM